MALMKASHTDLSKLLSTGEDTMSEYEKKLATARSLVVNTVEKRFFENKPKISDLVVRQMSQEERCRIGLDDLNELFLTVVPYKGRVNIHIRHFTAANNGLIPTKKGVTFPLSRWLMFESILSDIQKCMENSSNEQMKWHIGGGVYVSITPGYSTVDVRHFWKPDDALEPVPTRKGVTLNKHKFARLLEAVEEVHECVPELNDTEFCAFSESHQNQLGMLNCPECTPFGYEPKEDVSLECNAGDLQEVLNIDSAIE
jgi:hypothetical protein